jgi:hypothetical protein
MKERPILFSGPMVRAILDERKTQTRRIMKPQPILMSGGNWYPSSKPGDSRNNTGLHYASEKHMRNGIAGDFSPWKPGDTLWVRETWQPYIRSASSGIRFKAGGPNKNTIDDDFERLVELLVRTGGDIQYKYGSSWYPMRDEVKYRVDWRPSIHMPKWAARIHLSVKAVRVERLQDISEADAMAEGVRTISINEIKRGAAMSERQDFAHVWDSINGAGAWDANPWVWVIEFERAST